ncbi:MAG TPA: AzlD domain-containing protein [Burkholderiaceae bacterium]|nr:AzlD domain-containing protein [Burkholderiaceae bacterium]
MFWVIALCGAGTLLIRLLPMIWQDKGIRKAAGQGGLRRALDAIGPSAIVALLAVSFWGMIAPQASLQAVAPIVAGLAGVWLGKRLLHTIAWATLAGVAAYGLSLWALGAVAVWPG